MSRSAKDDDSLLVQDPAVSRRTFHILRVTTAVPKIAGCSLDTRGSIPGKNTIFVFEVPTVMMKTSQVRRNLPRRLKESYILGCNAIQPGKGLPTFRRNV
jgi:hypothetical protein